MMKAILFSVLLFISLSSSEIIQFDITQESNCAAPIGCSFTNSSIWINNTIPYLSTDIVIISGSSADSQLLIYLPGNYSTYSINSLSLSNATLVLNDFATLQVVSFNFGDNSKFNTINASTFLVDPKGENRDVSVLSMPSHGDFTCEWNIGGYVLVNTTAILTGDITIDQSADVFLGNVFYYPNSIEDDYHNLHMGTINIPHYATVTFDDDVVAFFLNVSNNATVYFKGDVNISQIYISDFSVVNFEDNNVFLGPSAYSPPNFNSLSLSLSDDESVLPPLSGSASSQVVTSSCDLFILGEDAFTYAGSFSDDSFNQAQSNYYLQKMRVALPLSFYPTLTGNGLIIDGMMSTSNVVTAVGAGISITTSAMFYGPININTTIDVQQGGQLTFATDILGPSFNATYGPGASVTVAGIFMGQNIYIPSGASLVATTANSSLIINNLYIDGTLDCTKGNGFIQGGNVTLGPNSNYLASLRTQFNAPLSVTLGNVHLLGGNVSYTIDKRPVGNKEYELISTIDFLGYYVDGSFNGNHAVALHDSLVERTLPLKYTTGSVFVKYNLSVKDVPTWAWIVGAAGVAAIILIIVVISVCIVKRRRHNYKPVR